MVVLLVLLTFASALGIDYIKTRHVFEPRGTMYTTLGFECLGALAQDGGEKIEKK
jgi:hypothetical protein